MQSISALPARLVRVRSGLLGMSMLSVAALATAAEVLPQDVTLNGLAIEQSVSGAPGDADEGRKVFIDRSLGNCLACHANSDMSDQLFHGEVGPSLDGVATRWSEAQLRTIVVNSKAVFTEQTVMPGFYSLEQGADVAKDLVGTTILTAQQVEDVVAYLTTLK